MSSGKATPDKRSDVSDGGGLSCLTACFNRLGVREEENGDARVGLVFEDSMLLHAKPLGHPECPQRVIEMMARLQQSGLAARCVPLKPRKATDEELLRCHTAKHIQKVAEVSDSLAKSYSETYREENRDSVYWTPGTATAARFAAGCVVQAVQSVLKGEVQRAMAVVRPPGHHAVCDRAMGFCFFNNVAVAVRAALATPGVQRVAVVDWDVHHGNGVQDILYDEPRALFISLHRYGSWFYPGTGAHEEAGSGPGEGFNVNVPWTRDSRTDQDYQAAFTAVVEPVLRQFAPDLLIVCAGFDASEDDTIGDCDLTPAAYGWMTERLLRFAGGRVVLALEGGYNTAVTAACAAACVHTLLEGQARERPAAAEPSKGTQADLKKVYLLQRKYWRLLAPPSDAPTTEASEEEWAAAWQTARSVATGRPPGEVPSAGEQAQLDAEPPCAATAAADAKAAALAAVAAAAAARAAAAAAAANGPAQPSSPPPLPPPAAPPSSYGVAVAAGAAASPAAGAAARGAGGEGKGEALSRPGAATAEPGAGGEQAEGSEARSEGEQLKRREGGARGDGGAGGGAEGPGAGAAAGEGAASAAAPALGLERDGAVGRGEGAGTAQR